MPAICAHCRQPSGYQGHYIVADIFASIAQSICPRTLEVVEVGGVGRRKVGGFICAPGHACHGVTPPLHPTHIGVITSIEFGDDSLTNEQARPERGGQRAIHLPEED